MKIYKSTLLTFYFFFHIMFHSQIILSNSELLNYIIRLGDKNYRYNHISSNMNDDMIIDTGAYPLENVRKFYGITKDGKELFMDNSGNKNYHSSVTSSDEFGRVEGESFFVRITSSYPLYKGKERLVGISKNPTGHSYLTEIYKFENNEITIVDSSTKTTKSYFGDIISNVFSINRYPGEDSEYIYYTSYIVLELANKYKFKTKKTYYKVSFNGQISTEEIDSLDASEQSIVSCFFTDNKSYICFFIQKNNGLTIRVCDNENRKSSTIIYNYENYEERRFYKGIYFRNEIGFFAYFKYNQAFPTFSLYHCNSDNNMIVYKNYGIILPSKGNFTNNELLNDLIKLNDNTVCFVSASKEKTILNVIVFSLYDNDNYMNIRYYFIDIWAKGIKLFADLKLGLYNNYLIMAFSHCGNEACLENYYDVDHFSSLIYFGYANSTNDYLDVIDYIYLDNKNIQTDIIINFEKNLIIQNNLFGYVLKSIKIISISSGIKLLKNEEQIESDSIINKGEEVILNLDLNSNRNYPRGTYKIEFLFIITEPDFNTPNKYMEYIEEKSGNNWEAEKQFFKNHEYIGKSSILTIELKEDLTYQCTQEDLCSLCYLYNKDECVTCRYRYEVNNQENKKTCKEKEEPTTILPLQPTEKPTEKATEKPTEKPTQKVTEKVTEKETEKPTELATEKPTEKVTEKETLKPTETATEKVTENGDNPQTAFINEKTELSNNNITLCSNNDILLGKCSKKITNGQLGALYNDLKSKISSNTSEIIMTENVIFQISSLKEQKNNDNPNVSSIDLGECEEILKKNLSLNESQELIVFKMDIKSDDLSSTYVQYEIYDPNTLDIVPLDECKNIPINIQIPANLDENTESIYSSLSKSGYNLFDLNDDFYNDICSTYTTTNGTDLTLADRKNLIYDSSGDRNMCQNGCIFKSYNSTTKKSDCNCSVQTTETITDMEKINYEKSNFGEEFFETLNNSNFRVLKCYKLVFSAKGQKNNIGSYIMSAFCLIFLILLLIYIIKENSKINKYIKSILKEKKDFTKIDEKNKKDITFFEKKKKIEDKKIINNAEDAKTKKRKKRKLNKNKDIKSKNKKKSKKSKKEGNFPPKKKCRNDLHKNSSEYLSSIYRSKDDNKTEKILVSSKQNTIKTINIINISNIKSKNANKNYSLKVKGDNKENNLIQNTQDFLIENKIKKINDEEMNSLDYEIALVIDKRTYFQYYFSLLKKKQLLLFAFYPNEDYNLAAVKISLLILSFSLYFTVNGFFFSDTTMNKINEDHGKYDIFYQIPQMLYSTLITSVLNMILKLLSLSQDKILLVKQEKNYKRAKKISDNIICCLKAKITIFFALSLLFMLFFWYFISCFCAVYKNTQKILITDTLISFALSMIYPFAVNLLPGMLRIPALRSPEKNKKYLYKLSGYVAII